MNVVFLTLSRFTDISDKGIYPDLVRKFCNEGHNVYVVSPMERKFKKPTSLIEQDKLTLLKLKTLNLQQSGIFEKGLAYLMLEFQFIWGIRKYFNKVTFDLILYSTPPINIFRVINHLKKRNKAKTYLLLKDIYPQAAVDDKVFSQNSMIYRYFRNQERKLYDISDNIGCMSKANVEYLLKHNPELSPDKVEVNPNSIEPLELEVTEEQKVAFRAKHKIPGHALIFIYGGNLGKSQGIDFYLELLKLKKDDESVFFITIGAGSEYRNIIQFLRANQIKNALLLPHVPKNQYDIIVSLCDIGLIFLNRYFTVPNFPSRLLSYMEQKKTVLAATDKISDLGAILTNNGFGFWTLHGDLPSLDEQINHIQSLSREELERMGQRGFNYLMKHYTVDISYNSIIKAHMLKNYE